MIKCSKTEFFENEIVKIFIFTNSTKRPNGRKVEFVKAKKNLQIPQNDQMVEKWTL